MSCPQLCFVLKKSSHLSLNHLQWEVFVNLKTMILIILEEYAKKNLQRRKWSNEDTHPLRETVVNPHHSPSRRRQRRWACRRGWRGCCARCGWIRFPQWALARSESAAHQLRGSRRSRTCRRWRGGGSGDETRERCIRGRPDKTGLLKWRVQVSTSVKGMV